jgi:predicted CXXCH cytochrome family protein
MRLLSHRSLAGLVIVFLGLLVGLSFVSRHPTPTDLPTEQIKTTTPVELPLGASHSTKNVSDIASFFAGAQFVGSQKCQPCHEQQYENWRKTWHARMVRPASPSELNANFNNQLIMFERIPALVADNAKSLKITPKIRLLLKGTASDGTRRPSFTLLDQDNPANNQTYEIDIVLGGNWVEHYLVLVGDNHYPAPFRWVVTDQDWQRRGYRPGDWFVADGTPDGRPRRPDELRSSQSEEAKCSGCHRTGFLPEIASAKGIVTVAAKGEPGIGCEACHGPGGRHVKSKNPAHTIHPVKDLNAHQQSQLCGRCHHRGTNRLNPILSYPVGFLPGQSDLEDTVSMWHYTDPKRSKSNHFWSNDWAKRNRQQWQDFQKSVHFLKTDVTCVTCHSSHGQFFKSGLRLPREKICTACHTLQGVAGLPNAELFKDSPMASSGVTCVDCHMAKIGERAGRTMNNLNPNGDVSAHTFRVVSPTLTTMYDIPSACQACHSAKDNDSGLNTKEAQLRMAKQQAAIRQLISKTQTAITLSEANGATPTILVSAVSKLKTVLLDGSLGAHNHQKTRTLLETAITMLKEDLQRVSAGK